MWNLRRAREALLDTFGDVRMDGTMASISGTDHPHILITKSLYEYIEETRDYSLLMEENTYFEDGTYQTEKEQRVGTLLEHVLLLNLVAFYRQPECEEQADCFRAMTKWLDVLLRQKGIRHIEVLTELVHLLEHREDMLEDAEYRNNVLKQYEDAHMTRPNGSEFCWVKTWLPISQVVDGLESKIQWIIQHQKKEKKDEL